MKSFLLWPLISSLSLLLASAPTWAEDVEPKTLRELLEQGLPEFQPTPKLKGTITCVGPESMNPLISIWNEMLSSKKSELVVHMDEKNSLTVAPALIAGTAHLAFSQRLFKPSEIARFERMWGHPPSYIRIGMDALVVIVHPDNPLTSITLEQLESMYSSTEGGEDALKWSLALSDPKWKDLDIHLCGRKQTAQANEVFRQRVMADGFFKNATQEFIGPTSLVDKVAHDPLGIGYINYEDKLDFSVVKFLDIRSGKGKALPPKLEHIRSGVYPLSHTYYLYFNQSPNNALNPLVRELLLFLLSKEGQGANLYKSYIPLTTLDVLHEQNKFIVWPDFLPGKELKGNLDYTSANGLMNLMTLWSAKFRTAHSDVTTDTEGRGPEGAAAALAQGITEFAPMTRAFAPAEIALVQKAWGYPPTCVRVAFDVLAVAVHAKNPIKGLTLSQLDAFFSKNRSRKYPTDITNWESLGFDGPWTAFHIEMYGSASDSCVNEFFKEAVLLNGDFKAAVHEKAPGGVVAPVADDLTSIGYSRLSDFIGIKGVRMVPLSVDEKTPFAEPTPENARAGKYPLSRWFYLYFKKPPGQAPDPLVAEFLKFVLSHHGQELVEKDGYVPLTYQELLDERKKLEP